MDLTVETFPFSPYEEPMKVVLYGLFSIAFLAIATGVPLLVINKLKNWFVHQSIAKNTIGIILVSQWVIVGTYALICLLGSALCIYEAKYTDFVLLLAFTCVVLAPSACALLCWHHLQSCYRAVADTTEP